MVNDPRFHRRVPPTEGARPVTVNTDDPGVFATSLSSEYEALQRIFEDSLKARGLPDVEAYLEDLVEFDAALLLPGRARELLERPSEALRALPDLVEQQSRSDREALVVGISASLKDIVRTNPRILKELPGHVFENLFADALVDSGFHDVSLRARTDLGEVDILGFSRDLLGQQIGYIFELKQLGVSKRKVELREVTRLLGLRDGLRLQLGISQGVFVTTTSFTQPAIEAGAFYGLHLKDYEALLEWVARCYAIPGVKDP